MAQKWPTYTPLNPNLFRAGADDACCVDKCFVHRHIICTKYYRRRRRVQEESGTSLPFLALSRPSPVTLRHILAMLHCVHGTPCTSAQHILVQRHENHHQEGFVPTKSKIISLFSGEFLPSLVPSLLRRNTRPYDRGRVEEEKGMRQDSFPLVSIEKTLFCVYNMYRHSALPYLCSSSYRAQAG